MQYDFDKNEIILFQGDSITDTGRSYFRLNSLGEGYPLAVSQKLGALLPDHNIQCMNRGVSGNRLSDMKRRFKRDCTELYPFPTVVSIYIGINDTWRLFDMGVASPVERFEENYRELLDEVLEVRRQTKLILLTPYVLEDTPDKQLWHDDLDPKRAVVKRLAAEYGARFIDLQQAFEEEMKRSGEGPLHYTVDGVHPTPIGHALIADRWIEAFEIK